MELVPKKKTTAPVWTYFGLEKNKERRIKTKDITVCRKCYGHIHAKGGNTSNLVSHLKTHHPTLHGLVCSAMKSKKKEQQHSSYINEQQQQPIITSVLKKVENMIDKQRNGATLLMLSCSVYQKK